MFGKDRGKVIKLRKILYMDTGKKYLKVSTLEKTYEDVYSAFKECYLEVFHMPNTFELSLETCDKPIKEIAVFYGMEGVLK